MTLELQITLLLFDMTTNGTIKGYINTVLVVDTMVLRTAMENHL